MHLTMLPGSLERQALIRQMFSTYHAPFDRISKRAPEDWLSLKELTLQTAVTHA